MTEEQKTRLRELPLPPIEEPLAKERIVDRRQGRAPRNQMSASLPAGRDQDDHGPGRLVDNYV